MTVSLVPDLIDALVDAASTALPDLIVSDGFGITDDPGDFLMVGVDDPDSEAAADSASSELVQSSFTGQSELGELVCVALSWNGDGDPKAARDAAYTTVAAVKTVLPTLAVDGLMTARLSGFNLAQQQGDNGASATVTFRIAFEGVLA